MGPGLQPRAVGSACLSAAGHPASLIVPRRLFCGWKRKGPFTRSPVARPAFFAEQPFWSFLSERWVYAVQMCTMWRFCVLAFQMCTAGEMSFGKGRACLWPWEPAEATVRSLCGDPTEFL